MTTYEELVSPSNEQGEPVQKSKSPTALLVFYGLGLLFIILSLICRIPQVRTSLNSMLSSTPIDAYIVTMILLGIAVVICIIASVIETKLKKNNQLSENTAKLIKGANVICWILLAISILLNILNWFKF